jgi:hypothetical protein
MDYCHVKKEGKIKQTKSQPSQITTMGKRKDKIIKVALCQKGN